MWTNVKYFSFRYWTSLLYIFLCCGFFFSPLSSICCSNAKYTWCNVVIQNQWVEFDALCWKMTDSALTEEVIKIQFKTVASFVFHNVFDTLVHNARTHTRNFNPFNLKALVLCHIIHHYIRTSEPPIWGWLFCVGIGGLICLILCYHSSREHIFSSIGFLQFSSLNTLNYSSFCVSDAWIHIISQYSDT